MFWPYLCVVAAIVVSAYCGLIPTGFLRWPWADKMMHFVLIGAAAFWLDLWVGARDFRLGRYRIPLALVLIGGAAIVEEAIQLCAPTRSADVLDAVADLAGIVVALFASRWLIRRAGR